MVYIAVSIIAVLLISYLIARYEGQKPENRANLWSIVIDTLSNPAKMLVLGTSTLLLIASITYSIEMGDSLYERMLEVGWTDLSRTILRASQLVGCISTILSPVMALMMLDTTAMKRDSFNEEEAKKYQFKNTGLIILGTTIACVVGSTVLGYIEVIEMASAMSLSFLSICFGLGTSLIVYCYNKTGATWEEIAGFAATTLFAALVYSIDFYWNRRLTIEIPMTQLTQEILSDDKKLVDAINAMHDSFMNRTVITFMMIGMDILTSILGLLSGEIPWIMKIMRYRAWQSVNSAVVEIDSKTNAANKRFANMGIQQTTPPVKPPTTTTTPPPPPIPPSTGGGVSDPLDIVTL